MSNSKNVHDETIYGIKVAEITAVANYPIVSAYEFEFLKVEEVIKERLDTSTIYLITQRPLTYFDNVVIGDTTISFEITDSNQNPLVCCVDLVDNGICPSNEKAIVEVLFFSRTPTQQEPFRDVAAIKLFNTDRDFVLWWSPQKFLYEVLIKNLVADIKGDPSSFLDFEVHYIGKAFSQKVWDRLTGHNKMQKILTLEGPIGASPDARAPFEISLITLSIDGISEFADIPYSGALDREGVEPIKHGISNDEEGLQKFCNQPLIRLGDEALTRETEALLIQKFRPKYNEVMFDNYPNIEGGMRSNGYTWTDLTISRLPAVLFTEHHREELITSSK